MHLRGLAGVGLAPSWEGSHGCASTLPLLVRRGSGDELERGDSEWEALVACRTRSGGWQAGSLRHGATAAVVLGFQRSAGCAWRVMLMATYRVPTRRQAPLRVESACALGCAGPMWRRTEAAGRAGAALCSRAHGRSESRGSGHAHLAVAAAAAASVSIAAPTRAGAVGSHPTWARTIPQLQLLQV